MFTLSRENSRFFRIKRGLDKKTVEKELCVPVKGKTFAGKIVETSAKYVLYTAVPGDTYRSVAVKAGVSEEELKEANGGKPVYPTVKLFVPRTRA